MEEGINSLEHRVGQSRLWKWTKRLLIGATVTAAGVLGAYFTADKVLDSKYERHPEEKKVLDGGIEALFEGPREAQKYFSAEYVQHLTHTGYWKKMEQYELVDSKIFVDPTNERIGYYFVRYKEKSTGKVINNSGTFELVQEGGQWKIAEE